MTTTSVPSPETYLINKDGLLYAGTHLLIDVYGAKHLDDADIVKKAILDSAEVCGATLRSFDLYQFSLGGGIAAVAMLTQSHISLHSWPEIGYGAFDIFVCGAATPHKMIPVLKAAFEPATIQVTEVKRGLTVK